MKRAFAIGILLIVCFILQCTVFQVLSLASVSPNLLLVITSSLGFMRGEREGLLVGFFSGLLTDIFFGNDEDIKLPMIWIALSELIYGLSVYFFMFLMRSKFEFPFYFTHIILPELIYTVVLTIVIYRPIRSFNRFLERLSGELPFEYQAPGAGAGKEGE